MINVNISIYFSIAATERREYAWHIIDVTLKDPLATVGKIADRLLRSLPGIPGMTEDEVDALTLENVLGQKDAA